MDDQGVQGLDKRLAVARRSQLAPQPALTLSQWTHESRVISPDTAALPGRWKTENMPHLCDVLAAIITHGVQTVTASPNQLTVGGERE